MSEFSYRYFMNALGEIREGDKWQAGEVPLLTAEAKTLANQTPEERVDFYSWRLSELGLASPI